MIWTILASLLLGFLVGMFVTAATASRNDQCDGLGQAQDIVDEYYVDLLSEGDKDIHAEVAGECARRIRTVRKGLAW